LKGRIGGGCNSRIRRSHRLLCGLSPEVRLRAGEGGCRHDCNRVEVAGGPRIAGLQVLLSVELRFPSASVGPQWAVGRIRFVGNGASTEWDFPSYRKKRAAKARGEGTLWALIKAGG
jgi:hypothetical protein